MVSLEEIANKQIILLEIKCKRGIYHERLFNNIINRNVFTLDKIEWLEKYVSDKNHLIAASALKCLCYKGRNIEDFVPLIQQNWNNSAWCYNFIEIAKKQNKPNAILPFLEEDSNIYLNQAILALKQSNNESYLATLMLSNNENFAKVIARLTCNKRDTQN